MNSRSKLPTPALPSDLDFLNDFRDSCIQVVLPGAQLGDPRSQVLKETLVYRQQRAVSPAQACTSGHCEAPVHPLGCM